jgi:hypothetical protein
LCVSCKDLHVCESSSSESIENNICSDESCLQDPDDIAYGGKCSYCGDFYCAIHLDVHTSVCGCMSANCPSKATITCTGCGLGFCEEHTFQINGEYYCSNCKYEECEIDGCGDVSVDKCPYCGKNICNSHRIANICGCETCPYCCIHDNCISSSSSSLNISCGYTDGDYVCTDKIL